ncbi:MAG: hypothetical protein KDD89_05540 [Anaerolineales bacterium]|nr:hypothetical protein [Anaerolineales bacterium]
MSLKAYTVTCEKYYPNRVVHYAAHNAAEATNLALAAIRRVGGNARTADIECEHAPALDAVAAHGNRVGVLKEELMAV